MEVEELIPSYELEVDSKIHIIVLSKGYFSRDCWGTCEECTGGSECSFYYLNPIKFNSRKEKLKRILK